MSDENTTEAVVTTSGEVLVGQPDGAFRKAAGQTDWARLEAMADEDIDDSDLPELDAAFLHRRNGLSSIAALQRESDRWPRGRVYPSQSLSLPPPVRIGSSPLALPVAQQRRAGRDA